MSVLTDVASGFASNAYESYFNGVKRIVDSLESYPTLSGLLGMALTEPHKIVRVAIDNIRFASTKLDDKNVAPNQPHILLLHGAGGSCRYMTTLARYLKSHGVQVSAIDLGSESNPAKNRSSILEKVEEIRRSYTRLKIAPPRIDLLAHSLGASFALPCAIKGGRFNKSGEYAGKALKVNRNIGKIITLAMPYDQKEVDLLTKAGKVDETYNVMARYDVLVGKKTSALPAAARSSVDCGHIGIVYDAPALQEIARRIKGL